MWDRQLDMELLTLENATNGYALNPRAIAEGRSPRDLFHVNEQTAYAWASEETKRYWADAGGRPNWLPAPADMGAALEAGRAAAKRNESREALPAFYDLTLPHDRTLAKAWRNGHAIGTQEALQERYGDPATA